MTTRAHRVRHARRVALRLAALLVQAGTAHAWTTQEVQLVQRELPVGTVHLHQMLPMRDGLRLSTHLFLPAGHPTSSYPVVVVRSAYNDWRQRASYANDVVTPNGHDWINTNGYVFVFQDLRGDGESETNADFNPLLSDNEINDTYDTVEALATNRWCNGRVGLYGNSGHGMAAYMGWLSRAPHLVVCQPANTAPNLHEHWSFENGVRRWIYRWLSFRDPRMRPRPEWPKPTLDPGYDRMAWQTRLREGARENPTVLLTQDSWHNIFLNSTFETWAALGPSNRALLQVNAGTHQGPLGLTYPSRPSGLIRYPTFFQILDGADVPPGPHLKYFVLGDARRSNARGNFYRLTQRWPPPATPTPYFFHADGSLSPIAPTANTATLSYAYHPTNPVPTVGGHFSYGFGQPSGPLNQLVPALTGRTDILRFVSTPVTQAVEVTGPLQATLYVSTDVPDSTFMVKLIDVYPAEGTQTHYQAILRESAIMARYAQGRDRPAPLVSGQVYRLDLALPDLAWLVETGHCVAVHITSSSHPAFEIHPNTYEPVSDFRTSPTAHHTLHLDRNHPSRLVLPLVQEDLP